MENNMICFKNGKYLSEDGNIQEGPVFINQGKIVDAEESATGNSDCEVIDITDKIVIPGLIDIHFHGAVGADLMYANSEEIMKISKFLAENGTTSYLATTITSMPQGLKNAVKIIKDTSEKIVDGASIEGIHIEGPYISPNKKGCHKASYMRSPQNSEYDELKSIAGTLKLHFTVAPEVENVPEFINYVSAKGDTLSIGHSDANSEFVKRALMLGATSFTHLFNAMRGINHREPGVAGEALISDAFVELICDGVHVNKDIMKMIYRLKGRDKIILVTDAMQATGLGDGEFEFGGYRVYVRDGIARNEDGALASSTLTMLKAVKNMIGFVGVPFSDAVRMATANPAKLLCLYDEVGSISAGKRADLLIVDEMLNLDMVFCKGVRIK